MWKDDVITSCMIQKKLARCRVMVHSSIVRKSRKQQGWTLQQTRSCQLIRDANKVKCLEFAQKVLESKDTLDMSFLLTNAQSPSNNSTIHVTGKLANLQEESINRSTH